MYERTYGSKYDKALGTKEIAAAFRKDVAAAQKAGELPKTLKLSVRIERFSGGSSIDVNVTECPLAMFSVEWLERDPKVFTPNCQRYTEKFAALLETLKGMLAAYNHDGSDIMTDYFDVKFYAHVGVKWELERDREQAERDAIALVVVEAPTPMTAEPAADENPLMRAW